MSFEWVKYKLNDLITIKHGFAFKGQYFCDEETKDCLITPGNFSIGGGFKGDKLKYYNGPVAKDYILKEGDLVVTMTDLSKQADTLGYAALVPDLESHRILHNQRVGLVENISDEINKEFLYFLLRSSGYRHHVVSGATGTTVKHTSPTKILSYEFQLPPLYIQQQIAKNLIDLERKANINTQNNQTLESMAQAIFKSWFVDFDPVKAKMRGEQPVGMDDATAALFPDTLVESELGLIPEGWDIDEISTLFELHRGFDLPKSKRQEGSIPVFAAGGYHGTHNEYKMEPPGIITGRSGVIGNVYLSLEKYWPLNTTLYIRNFRGCGPYYAYHLLRSLDLKSLNSGSAVPSLNRNFVHSMKTLLPDRRLLTNFEKLVTPLFETVVANIEQNNTLSSLRDTLLPKLLSGEIDLSNINTLTEVME